MNAWNVVRYVEESWVTSLAVAGAAASLYGIIPDSYARDVCLAVAYASVAALAIAVTSRGWRWWQNERPQFIIHSRVAVDADLPVVFRVAQRAFGPKITSVGTMRQWHQVNPRVFCVIERVGRTQDGQVTAEISGYFATVPMNKEVTDRIVSGKVSILDLDARDICSPSEVPSGIYVGAVVAMDGPSRGAAIIALRGWLRHMSRGRRATLLISNPVTSDGLQLIRTCGMRPAAPGADSTKKVLHASTIGEIDDALRERSQTRTKKAIPSAPPPIPGERAPQTNGRPAGKKSKKRGMVK